MQINQQGWLSQVRHCPSPHFNQRPDQNKISLLVVHNISLPPGQFNNHFIDDLFLGKLDPEADPYFASIYKLQVSAHCLIKRCGEITQYVSFNHRAWHAGVSSYCGQENCNDFSIGIELEGTDILPYTDAQYGQLVSVACALLNTYPSLSVKDIVGHCDIAPDRKTDPGQAFDWQKFNRLLSEKINQ